MAKPAQTEIKRLFATDSPTASDQKAEVHETHTM